MKNWKFYLVNGITGYRIAITPVLIGLIIAGNYEAYRWLLPVSFFTDLIDGFLARKLKVTSILGSKLDSIGDDLTFLSATIGVFVFKYDFIVNHLVWVSILLGLYFLQMGLAFARYHKMTSFHTYMGKTAMVFQGFFLIFLFLLPEPLEWLFYSAAIITIIDLVEEIIIILYNKKWEANVKGLFWVIRKHRLSYAQNKTITKFKVLQERKRSNLHLVYKKN